MKVKLVETEEELKGIILLQQQNLKNNISGTEAEKEGFLTAEYTLEYLKYLHKSHPSVIATENNAVVGYALAAEKTSGLKHDLLADLILTVNNLEYKGQNLEKEDYIVVGQLCVGKAHRGKGLVSLMYNKFRASLQQQYRYCITDIAENNPRSLNAHLKTGFKVLDRLIYGGIVWNIVIWDWTE